MSQLQRCAAQAPSALALGKWQRRSLLAPTLKGHIDECKVFCHGRALPLRAEDGHNVLKRPALGCGSVVSIAPFRAACRQRALRWHRAASPPLLLLLQNWLCWSPRAAAAAPGPTSAVACGR